MKLNIFKKPNTIERVDKTLSSHEKAILLNYLCITRNELRKEYSETGVWSLQHDALILDKVVDILRNTK